MAVTKPYARLGVTNLLIACASAGKPGIATAFQTAALLSVKTVTTSIAADLKKPPEGSQGKTFWTG